MTSNQKQLKSILLSLYIVSSASYLIAPILPIYFIETIAKGGLAWPKSVALPLVGTYLAMTYIAPCIGGILADTCCGRTWTVVIGYCFTFLSIIVLHTIPLPELIPYELSVLALGIGIIKVCLTATIASFCSTPEESQKAYGNYYVVACLGFVTGGLLSNPIFDWYGMNTLLMVAFGGIGISLFFSIPASMCQGRHPQEECSQGGIDKQSPSSNMWLFATLLIIGTPFFICSNQLNTSVVVFLHTAVDRTIGTWTIPTLWFGALGSLTVTILSPFIRKAWAPLESRYVQVEPLKIAAGGVCAATALAILAMVSMGYSNYVPIPGALWLLALVHIGIMVADSHVRPTLFSAATRLTPPRFHTFATALVYTGVGTGGKLAGYLAGAIDSSGFPTVFTIATCIAIGCSSVCIALWVKLRTRSEVRTETLTAKNVLSD